jgi:hypothetical protein
MTIQYSEKDALTDSDFDSPQVRVSFLLPESEVLLLQEKAKKEGVSLEDYLRWLVRYRQS